MNKDDLLFLIARFNAIDNEMGRAVKVLKKEKLNGIAIAMMDDLKRSRVNLTDWVGALRQCIELEVDDVHE